MMEIKRREKKQEGISSLGLSLSLLEMKYREWHLWASFFCIYRTDCVHLRELIFFFPPRAAAAAAMAAHVFINSRDYTHFSSSSDRLNLPLEGDLTLFLLFQFLIVRFFFF